MGALTQVISIFCSFGIRRARPSSLTCRTPSSSGLARARGRRPLADFCAAFRARRVSTGRVFTGSRRAVPAVRDEQ